jgi:hypothetical protein
MSSRPSPLASLPLPDRILLRCTQHLVPRFEREEWLRTWHAELWHMHHCIPRRRLNALRLHLDLPLGIACDALCLRTHSLKRSFGGTPTLCIAGLLSLSALSFVFALLSYGGWRTLGLHLNAQAEHSLVAAPLILFVGYAVATFSRVQLTSISNTLRWINHQLFVALKTVLVLLLMFLLSVDVARPLYLPLPNAADLFQILFFVLFSLIALRWSFHDQEQRCKHCLCSLATPARVGRPSHNLLEWTGTEQTCKQGHGRLSIPEIETSWRQYSRWIEAPSTVDRIASA